MKHRTSGRHQKLGLGQPIKGEFEMTESTLLRSLMAHLQSLARSLAANYFETISHDHVTEAHVQRLVVAARNSKLKKRYTELINDLIVLFPGEVHPVSFGELAQQGSFDRTPLGGRDPYRISMRVLKQRADKYRACGHPEFKLLKGAVLKKRQSPDDW